MTVSALEQAKVELPNGETVNYRMKKGGKEVLLLIHGNMNSSLNWDVLMNELPEHITAYAIDLRGFGDSTYHTPIHTIKDLSDDVKLFADALKLSAFTISGWSLGGAVAMQYVIDHPDDAKNLILLSSVNIKGYPIPRRTFLELPIPNNFIQTKEEVKEAFRMVENAKETKNTWFLKMMLRQFLYTKNKPSADQFEKYLEGTINQRNLIDINYALMRFNISNDFNGVVEGTGEVEKITIPTMVIQGDEDKMVSTRDASDIAKGIGENATLKIMKGVGHCPLLDDLSSLMDLYNANLSRA
ncbi:intracellular short-chain-length polyhydroxyalkanoate depolymerase [Priestia megaterium]|uniref:intracellular short-chain-length polyhydroxyalkanoate depolymerase n=1 Tax=Priestia megaterium TaxID=1404 RepID=UPI00298CBFC3|nr:alpha/beta hydrolase [Priestia megaterium]MED4139907.1 alpha/beta hydrolase [Priestia megaterium]